MRLTPRDLRLVRDIALSRIASRDQIIKLGYFGSVTRANTRLRLLADVKFLSICATPYFRQQLYAVGLGAKDVVGEKIANAISKSESPRFVQHALAVNDVRIALAKQGFGDWRFEPQLRHSFLHAGRRSEIRPDGLVKDDRLPIIVEVDLGHVAPKKFAEKIRAYEAFMDSGEARHLWHAERFKVLTITTGGLRKSHLARYAQLHKNIIFEFQSFGDLGVEVYGGWS